MGIQEQLEQLKVGFSAAMSEGNGKAAYANAVSYANMLRQIAEPPLSYADRAFLKKMAELYDYAAAIIKMAAYKIDAKTRTAVYACIEHGEIPGKKKAEAPAPKAEAPAPKRKAEAPTPKATAATPTAEVPTPKAPDTSLTGILAGLGATPPPPTAPKKKRSTATAPAAPEMPTAPKATEPAATTPDPAFAGLLSQLGIGVVEPKKPATAPAAPATPKAPAPATAPKAAPPAHVFEGSEWSADVFERFLPATVVVRSDEGVGTGFFFRSDGYILTNHHVAYLDNGEPSSSLYIESGDKKLRGKAKLLHADKKHDVALLKFECTGPVPFIPLEEDYASRVRPGIEITIIGNALNFGLAPINGTVKFTARSGNIVYTAPTNHGDSGSPVISRDGKCVGIHKSSTTQAKGLSNGTPASDILALLKVWLKNA